MSRKKSVLLLVLLLTTAVIASVVWQIQHTKKEQCTLVEWKKEGVVLKQNGVQSQLDGVDGAERNPPDKRDHIGDLEFHKKDIIIAQWILSDVQNVKPPQYEKSIPSMDLHVVDLYHLDNKNKVIKVRNLVKSRAQVNHGHKIDLQSTERILVSNIHGRRAFVQYFRDMSDTNQYWLNSGMDAVWYGISDDSRFVLRFENRTNQNEVLINNTVINGIFNEAGLNADQLEMNSVNWWRGSFYVVDLQGRLHKFTPRITEQNETNRDDLMGNTEPAPELKEIVSERFPEIKKTWLRKVNVKYERASTSEFSPGNKGGSHSQFILRRSLNRLYLLVYRRGDNILLDEPVQLYRVREDGSLKPVKKNRGLKIKGLKHGDRRMYCEQVKYLKLWGYTWSNPPEWITELVA